MLMLLRILLLLSCAPAIAAAQTQYPDAKPAQIAPQYYPHDACPWLTQGTAVRALGGEVSLDIHVSEAGDGSCKFTAVKKASDFIDIRVSQSTLAACAQGSTTTRGVGNEALRCKSNASPGSEAEMISSRVRDKYFTVTLSPSDQKGAPDSTGMDADSLQIIAEQIAGNLF
jgi:hypothetical protein